MSVTLNFHPDRSYGGVPILHALTVERVYRSQFETGTSNGGLTAYVGGDRWAWESRIFGGAYDQMPPEERPKYGALNYKRRAIGGASRFGSAHFRLRSEALERCTFCYPDSVFEPTHFGVSAKMGLVARALNDANDPLDDYIEAHIHGPIRLSEDVEALVLDPCYQGTEIEVQAHRLPCAIEWHPGFRLPVETLRQYPEYRGKKYVDLGLKIARDGCLDPACIGKAACTGAYDPQDLKKVWHYLARYGEPSLSPDAA
ncbi:DUF3626 domain-containing protein [Cupriavidus sp. BIS7]|uniref:DUF3626 domain-containing protein n=1 Tax=Cupriavidus sp. BIS7 TaxID=1217718 RepID=UPI001ED94581|nr:DUF3626 domain-containing protein [Cupriavidus sp. BIS7]